LRPAGHARDGLVEPEDAELPQINHQRRREHRGDEEDVEGLHPGNDQLLVRMARLTGVLPSQAHS
jgi:hypothetical protein